jgi:hypothetical protein
MKKMMMVVEYEIYLGDDEKPSLDHVPGGSLRAHRVIATVEGQGYVLKERAPRFTLKEMDPKPVLIKNIGPEKEDAFICQPFEMISQQIQADMDRLITSRSFMRAEEQKMERNNGKTLRLVSFALKMMQEGRSVTFLSAFTAGHRRALDLARAGSRGAEVTWNSQNISVEQKHGKGSVRFSIATLAGAACEHTNVLIVDDPHMIKKQVLDEAMAIPAPMDGHPAVTVIGADNIPSLQDYFDPFTGKMKTRRIGSGVVPPVPSSGWLRKLANLPEAMERQRRDADTMALLSAKELKDIASQDPLVDAIVKDRVAALGGSTVMPTTAKTEEKCECGAAKLGMKRGSGHSTWCPWSKP